MYESFYGLKEKPFNLTPDPDYLYMSPGHENVYSHLEYAIQENKGFVVVTGEVGSGKTTLINYLIRKIPVTINVGIINNTFVQPLELLKMICQEFDLQTEHADKTVLLERFSSYLLEQYSRRERVTLIIDEAQNLPDKSLEQIRMLSNLESEKHHLIQMILVGQPQLREKLQKKSLEQFVQRVTVYCHLDALDKEQVEQYIRHRLKVAGAQNLDTFDTEAISAIFKHSRGIPRLINTLCDSAFVYGYADDVKVIGRDLIEAVAQARNLGAKGESSEMFPEEKENVAALVEGTPAWLQELKARISMLEDRLVSQNGDRDERVKLYAMLDERDKRIRRLSTQVEKLRKQLFDKMDLSTNELSNVEPRPSPPQENEKADS